MYKITLEHITHSYGDKEVLQDFSFSFQQEKITCLLGPSGCGKTTVLRLVAGLETPSRGEIKINGAVVSKNGEILLPPHQRKIGFVFQDLALWPHFDFSDFAAGKLPSGWSQFYTGQGGTDWKVLDDQGNKVLAQLYSDNPNNHFNVVVNDEITAKDMELTVRLKGISGNHDQGGGFVWRFTDKNNYYVVRANPLEDNVVLYKVENGKRTDLPLLGKGRTYGVDVPPLGNGWNTLKLVVKDDLFTVFLNDKEVFKVQDKTFTNAGKVGLWTKADAVTYFDDMKIQMK